MWDGSRVRDPEGAASPFSLLPTVVRTDEVCPSCSMDRLDPVSRGSVTCSSHLVYPPFLAIRW